MSRYVIMPKEILETEAIGNGAKVMYLRLVDFAFNKIYCFPSMEKLAEQSNVSIKTVQRAIKELKEIGLVKVYNKGFKCNNTYVIIPIEWVDGLGNAKPLRILPEDEQIITTEESYTELLVKIKEHYVGIGRGLADNVKPKRTKIVKKKTEAEVIGEIQAKLDAKDYDFTSNQLCHVYRMLYEEMRGEKYSITWTRENPLMNKLFVKSGLDKEYVIKFIIKYIEIYDRYFKRGKYTKPRMTYLGQDFIYNKVKEILDADMVERPVERVLDIEF